MFVILPIGLDLRQIPRVQYGGAIVGGPDSGVDLTLRAIPTTLADVSCRFESGTGRLLVVLLLVRYVSKHL